MKRKLRHLLPGKRFRKKKQAPVEEAPSDPSAPRITNETVAAHREEVLSSARKYIYPLQHSKHKVVVISTALFVVVFIAFFSYCLIALYRFHSTSTFTYRVTQVLPFPIGKAGPRFVAYENYLFELRRYVHYFETQQNIDFNDSSYRQQLADFQRRALDKVVNDAYVKQLASQQNVSVSDREVDDQIAIARAQNRLGGDEQVFEDVIKDFWGWSVGDFKRYLRQELLTQKVVAALDTETRQRADAALAELKNGKDFAEVARAYSDDADTKPGGGEFGFLIDRANRNVPPQTSERLFQLKPGDYSDVFNVGYALEIVKNLAVEGDKIKAAHIVFNFRDVNTYINEFKEKHGAQLYVNL